MADVVIPTPGAEWHRDIVIDLARDDGNTFRFYSPVRVEIETIRGQVLGTAIGAATAATFTFANSAAAAMVGGVLTAEAADAAAHVLEAVTPTTNNVIAAGSYCEFAVAKADNVTGVVRIDIEGFQREPV